MACDARSDRTREIEERGEARLSLCPSLFKTWLCFVESNRLTLNTSARRASLHLDLLINVLQFERALN